MKPMTLIDFINDLWAREIETSATDDSRLLIRPGSKLNDHDRAFIRAHRDRLLELVRGGEQLQHLPDGWQQSEGTPERVMLVNAGRLINSAIFHTETGAKAFLELVKTYAPAQAFRAACAIEDQGHDPAKFAALTRAA